MHYEITPPGGKVRVYRTPDDPEPIVLEGPGGERLIPLSEPRTLYYEFLAGADNFKLWTAGWKGPQMVISTPVMEAPVSMSAIPTCGCGMGWFAC